MYISHNVLTMKETKFGRVRISTWDNLCEEKDFQEALRSLEDDGFEVPEDEVPENWYVNGLNYVGVVKGESTRVD